ncbi:MAG TPA: dienelactone hydrolase family protein [Polyangiaceae bacterium]|nr:dienelactone hydrolase family protein [Polyangiaceae bacterium]
MRRFSWFVATLSLYLSVAVLACRSAPTAGGAGGSNPAVPTSTAAVGSAASAASSGGSAVELEGGGRGYLVLPEGNGKHPAVIVIQEWWGLTDWIRENTARFARQGYVALAVDLYRGRATADPGEAHELMRGLPEDRALRDLQAGVSFLAARADVDAEHIGSVGWCMGGGYSLALATAEPRLRAAVVNYGRLVTEPAKLEAIRAAVLGNFAGADRGIPPDDVHTFERQLKAVHKDADIRVFEGKAHGFMNPGNKDGYDTGASTEAWSRIDAFFARTLKAK